MNNSVCRLPLKSVNGCEKSRLDQRCIANVQNNGYSLNTCTQPYTPLINGSVDHSLWKG